jgi:hypothetical protein
MLTALFFIAIFFGLIQEMRIPGRLRVAGFRARKQAKRSALVTVTEKPKA